MSEETTKPKASENSIVRGVFSNWAGYVVVVASGFIIPRLIGDHLGQEILGIWDFSWAMVAYATFLNLGISAAAARYVARYRKLEDWQSLNRIVNSCAVLLGLAFVLGAMLVALLFTVTPQLLRVDDPAKARLAQSLVAILGFSAAIQLPLGLFNGVLSGCRRFDLLNLIRSACYVIALVVMVVFLVMGRGLVSVAWAALASEVAIGLLNVLVSLRLCPQLRFAPSLVTRQALGEVIGYGGKTILQGSARMGMYQTSALIVSYFLGPAVLAVYARQRALVMLLSRLMNQYGNVFSPTASALHAANDDAGLRALLIKSARYGMYISLPIVVMLSLGGGTLVKLWMGSGYEAPAVLAILAVGHLASASHRGVYMILAGMNRHGAAAFGELIGAVASVAMGFLFVAVLGWGLVGAALSVALAVAVGGGLVPAVHACRVLGISFASFVRQVLPGPVLLALPLLVCMLTAKWFSGGSAVGALIAGVGGGGIITLPLYWRFVLPTKVKDGLSRRLRRSRPQYASARDIPVEEAGGGQAS